MYFVSHLSEVDPVTGAKIDSQFYNSSSYAAGITHVSTFNSINSIANDTASLGVKSVEPLKEGFTIIGSVTDEYFSRLGFHSFSRHPSVS